MAVAPDDLLEPLGPIAPSLFPGEGRPALEARLGAYLAQAGRQLDAAPVRAPAPLTAAERDAAAAAWAEYRAWDAVAARMTSTPASVTLADQGARTYTGAQLTDAGKRRDAALARYNTLVPGAQAPAGTREPAAVVRTPAASGYTPVVVVW